MHVKVFIFSFDVLKVLPPFHFLKIISSACFWPRWVFTLLGLPSGCRAPAPPGGGLTHSGAWAQGARASVLVAPALRCSEARGTFPDQELNLCLLRRPADSLSPRYQGSAPITFRIPHSADSRWATS